MIGERFYGSYVNGEDSLEMFTFSRSEMSPDGNPPPTLSLSRLISPLHGIPHGRHTTVTMKPVNVSPATLFERCAQYVQPVPFPYEMTVSTANGYTNSQVLLAPAIRSSHLNISHQFQGDARHALFLTPNNHWARMVARTDVIKGSAAHYTITSVPPYQSEKADVIHWDTVDRSVDVVVPIADDVMQTHLTASFPDIRGVCPFSGKVLVRFMSSHRDRQSLTSESVFAMTEISDLPA